MTNHTAAGALQGACALAIAVLITGMGVDSTWAESNEPAVPISTSAYTRIVPLSLRRMEKRNQICSFRLAAACTHTRCSKFADCNQGCSVCQGPSGCSDTGTCTCQTENDVRPTVDGPLVLIEGTEAEIGSVRPTPDQNWTTVNFMPSHLPPLKNKNATPLTSTPLGKLAQIQQAATTDQKFLDDCFADARFAAEVCLGGSIVAVCVSAGAGGFLALGCIAKLRSDLHACQTKFPSAQLTDQEVDLLSLITLGECD
jgi:hypothetical protein